MLATVTGPSAWQVATAGLPSEREGMPKNSPGSMVLAMFRELDFGLFRLVGDSSMLVPVADNDVLDNFNLNYFAARPELASRLAAAGLLAAKGGCTDLSDDERAMATDMYCALPLAESLEISAGDVTSCPYSKALLAYAAYRFLPSLLHHLGATVESLSGTRIHIKLNGHEGTLQRKRAR